MTPKEKAKELFDKYCYALRTEEQIDAYWTNVIHAKQCALIAVDEIIKANPNSNPFNTDVVSTMKYWNEVRHEIEKL
jgi:hypothetical protein